MRSFLKCTVVLCLKRNSIRNKNKKSKRKNIAKQAQKQNAHTDLIIYTELALFNQIST